MRIALTDGEMHYVDEGTGPPILFVHGASNAGTSWAPLIAGLPGYRCLALDRPASELLHDPDLNRLFLGGHVKSA